MSEYISVCEKIDKKQEIDLEKIGRRALSIVDRKYGRGIDALEQGEQNLQFHNGEHSRMVGWAAAKMCATLELSPAYQQLGKTVGYAHDIVQLKGAGINEEESASWLDATMERFPEALRAMASKAIIGTTPLFENNLMIGQRAAELDYSSHLEEAFAKSVACADLSELYSSMGPYSSHRLLHEFNPGASEDELLQKAASFQQGQCELVERYQYPLAEGEELFGKHRAKVIAFTARTLRELEAGIIGSWRELVERDLDFKRTLEQQS